ncbi:MAG TPA: YbaN family protein [Candidatus Coprenecus pullistercoris]|nr:YbaN family protein [Candidatus Coprenecus pullistercoris]
MNYLLIVLGAVSLGFGVAGMFLPVLPTTPFLLLTAWCWLKGSPRLHAWLMSQPKLGPYIRDFQEHKCISRKVKTISVITLWLTITLSIVLVHQLWLRILLAIIAIGVTWHILSFKTKK